MRIHLTQLEVQTDEMLVIDVLDNRICTVELI